MQQTLINKQKEALLHLWLEMVVFDQEAPDNFLSFSNEEIRAWLLQTVMKNIATVVEERDIFASLPETFSSTEDAIRNVGRIVFHYRREHFSRERQAYFDSWPKTMRASGEFNCVGSSLIGAHIFSKLGIDSLVGMPAGHVVNIVPLKDGKTAYVDLLNGVFTVSLQKPKFEDGLSFIEGLTLEKIPYQLTYLFPHEAFSANILGNIRHLKHLIETDTFPNEKIEKESRILWDKYHPFIEDMDIVVFEEILFPQVTKMKRSKKVEQERERIQQWRREHENKMRRR